MKRKRLITVTLLLMLSFVLIACTSGNTGVPPPGTTVIPDSTKVIDQKTRDSLVEFTNSGELRFSQSTAQLAALEVGNVVVSEPSSAAPSGYLRKVTAVRQEGGGVVVETVHATLDEAVAQGSLSVEEPLTPADLESSQVFLAGVSIEMATELGTESSHDFDFTVDFDKVLFDLDGDEKTENDQMTLGGKFQFDVFAKVDVDISWLFDAKKFEASLGFRQKAELEWVVAAVVDIPELEEQVFKVAEFSFGKKTFFIGPVPVVMEPKIELFVGAEGNFSARTKLVLEQTLSMVVGARWKKSEGWKNISDVDMALTFEPPEIDGLGMKAKGFIKPQATLLFYGVFGPNAFIKLYGEIDFKVPRDPVWIASAGIIAALAIDVDLPIIGKLVDLDLTVLDEKFELARSEDAKPSLTIISPSDGDSLTLNRQVSLIADASDPEDGIPDIAWSSDVDGNLGSSVVIAPTFTTAGPRVITAEVTDSSGKSVSDMVSVAVMNTPPTPFVFGPEGSVPATVQALFIGGGTDPNDPNEFGVAAGVGIVTCDRVGWSVTAPDTVTSPNGCQVGVVFNAQGTRTVTLTATDIHGATTSIAVDIDVTTPPASPPPVIEVGSLVVKNVAGDVLTPGLDDIDDFQDVPLTLTVTASDPESEPLTFSWQASVDSGNFIEIGITGTLVWNPGDDFNLPGPTSSRSLGIRVEVSDGTTVVRSPTLEFQWNRPVQ